MLHNTLVHTFDSNETSSNRSLDTKIFFSIANGFLNQLRIYQFIFLLFLHHMFFFLWVEMTRLKLRRMLAIIDSVSSVVKIW